MSTRSLRLAMVFATSSSCLPLISRVGGGGNGIKNSGPGSSPITTSPDRVDLGAINPMARVSATDTKRNQPDRCEDILVTLVSNFAMLYGGRRDCNKKLYSGVGRNSARGTMFSGETVARPQLRNTYLIINT